MGVPLLGLGQQEQVHRPHPQRQADRLAQGHNPIELEQAGPDLAGDEQKSARHRGEHVELGLLVDLGGCQAYDHSDQGEEVDDPVAEQALAL
jgi:hypothetical protein